MYAINEWQSCDCPDAPLLGSPVAVRVAERVGTSPLNAVW